MKRICPLSLVLILCASAAFSQQNQLIQGGNKSEPHAAPAQDNAQPLPVQSGGVVQPPTTSVVVAQAPALQWEVVNPFRFISHQGSIDELRRVYNGLSSDVNGEKTAYSLERELQRLADEAVDKSRATERERLKCDDKPSEPERRKCIDETKKPYPGWFAHLARNNHSGTCWDSRNQRFRDEGICKDYIHPKSHKVRVWISDSQLLGGRVPQWFIDNQPLTKSGSCSDTHQNSVCVEFDVEYDNGERKSKEISARFSDGSFTLAPLAVLVKDKLIVGLGDSYAAGEGNPDIPAQFTQGRAEKDLVLDFGIRDAPRKDKDTEVGWLDRRCHRSMYSYQFKTALHLALANPREAITYVSYSCSGATTGEIFESKQKAIEGGGRLSVQLEALRKVLGYEENDPREIDYLLLSTGGNDIGFGKYVAYVVTTGLALRIVARGINEGELKKSGEKFKETLITGKGNAQGNYPRLHTALLHKLQGIKIKGCEADKPCERILLTPYPDIFMDEKGEACKANRGEFDIPFRADAGRVERIKLLRQYVFKPLNELQLTLIPSALGWTVVTDHFGGYSQHGFCAQNAQSASATAEKFVIPERRGRVWVEFDPRDYKAYDLRQRWIRLPVDSKLTTDQVHIILRRISLDFAFEDDRSNIMHPTAEGLATHADANFKAIRKLEGKTN
jgi:hypothetical protein